MKQEPHQIVWDWYKQFSHDPADEDRRLSRNFFRRITSTELAEFKDEFGPILPPTYEKFLLEIGSGCLKEDARAKVAASQYNEFLSLREITSIMRREAIDGISADIIAGGELPFFLEFADSVFVIDQMTGEIHYPGFVEQKYADTFSEFLSKLMVDCEFYVAKIAN